MQHLTSRRNFIFACSAVVVGTLLPRRSLRGTASIGPHPAPRAGITGAKVATREQLAAKPQLVDLFDAVRENPQVIDGIRCNCGCAQTDGFYSLLTCYEGESAMARDCAICQGQGRLAVRLHKLGRSLDEIRSAIDAKYA